MKENIIINIGDMKMRISYQTLFFVMRTGIIFISIFTFVLIFVELTKALGYGWSDSELTWFFVFGFGCVISFLLFILIVFKFTDYLEKYIKNLSKG